MAQLDSSRATILVADDEPEQLKIVGYALSRSFKVITARNMEEALAAARANRLDIVLCDYRMPGPDGIKTLASLREMQPNCIRFLVTAHGDIDILREAINSGAVYRFLSKPVQLTALVADVTRALEYATARGQLEKAERMALAGTLASMAVHDMRNALQGLSMVPALLADVTGPDIDLVRELTSSSYATMNDCVKEILTTAKGGTVAYELTEHSLTDLVSGVVHQFRSIYSTHSFVCQVPENGDKIAVRLAAAPIRRVISNLLLNAVQASPAGSTVRASVYASSAGTCFSVHDQGPGVAEENREKVFAGMFTTKGDSGTGLGLKQCRQIMRSHGGDLRLEPSATAGAAFVGNFPA